MSASLLWWLLAYAGAIALGVAVCVGAGRGEPDREGDS